MTIVEKPFHEKISDFRLDQLSSCCQCGSCTGTCTATEVSTDYNPRLAIRLASCLYETGKVTTRLPYINPIECFQCYACSNVCPRGLSPGEFVKAIRETNKGNGEETTMGTLKENLLTYGQSIIPEVFIRAEYIWGESWKETVNRPTYISDLPVKRDLPASVTDEIKVLTDSAERLQLVPSPRKKPGIPHIKRAEEVTVFESCCAFSHYPGISRSVKYVLEKLGIPFRTIPEQSCCGGFSYYANDLTLNELVLIGARNESLMEDAGDFCVTICPTCFSAISTVQQMLMANENLCQVNSILTRIGRKISNTTNIIQVTELIYANLDRITKEIKLDFSQLKIATHSGCHYRNFREGAETSDLLDILVQITGAQIIEYDTKYNCCGGGFEKSFRGDILKVQAVNKLKQKMIADMGADLVVLDCPGCEMTFDRNSAALDLGKPDKLGYVHILEFLALAMGASPERVAGVQYHSAYQAVNRILT